MIGENECIDIAVLSTTQLQCTAPAGTGTNLTVSVTSGERTQALEGADGYTYVDANAMTVTGTSPNVGPSFGGTYIKIIGNNFGENASDISDVTIGGETCTPTTEGVTNSTTAYYCILPTIDISENKFVDVVVTDDYGIKYELKDAFEYVKAGKDENAFEARIE
jgi:hypothetical protein